MKIREMNEKYKKALLIGLMSAAMLTATACGAGAENSASSAGDVDECHGGIRGGCD